MHPVVPARGVLGALVLGLLALALAGCPEGSGTSSTGGTGGATPTGGGGSGGLTTTSSTATTTTMTAPLTCPEPVTKPPVPNGECDLLQQNCPIGETCRPTADALSTFCRKEGGLKGPGKPCDPAAPVLECQAGLYCIGPPGGIGFCTRPCCPSTDEPCEGGDCNTEVNFDGGLTIFMCSYSKQCTLFIPGQCENEQKCQLVYPMQGLAVCTLPAQTNVPDGEPCGFVNECGEMSMCYGGTCRYSCKGGSGEAPGLGGCPGGQTCTVIYADNIGVCQPTM